MSDTTATFDAAAPAQPPTAEDPFRWRLAHRPDVRFGHAAAGAAGILVAAAVVAFVVAITDDDPTIPGVLLELALIALAVFAGWRVRGPVRSAAVAALVIAIPLLWLFAVVGDGDDVGRGDFRLIMLLTVASYVGFYLLTWTRGRAVLLGLALLVGASWLVFEVADQQQPVPFEVLGQTQAQGFGDPNELIGGDNTTETAIVEIVIGGVLLGAGVLLDRRGRAGAATPCLLVGGLFGVLGATTLGADVDDVYATGVFLAIAGVAIGLAGSLGRRRGTSWIGAVVLLAGAIAVIGQATDDAASGGGDRAAWRFGVFALLGAAVLLAVGFLIAQRLGEPVDGGEPAPPAAAPPAGD